MTRVPRGESDEPAALLCRCDDWRFNDDFVRALISPNPQFASDSFDPRRFLATSPASLAFYICRAGILHIQSPICLLSGGYYRQFSVSTPQLRYLASERHGRPRTRPFVGLPV